MKEKKRWLDLRSLVILGLLLAACAPALPPAPTAPPPPPTIPRAIPTTPLAPPTPTVARGAIAPVSATATPTMTELRVATPIPTLAAERPQYGGIFTQMEDAGPLFLDIHRVTSILGITALNQVHLPLIRTSTQDRSTIVPEIAESWDFSADRLTCTFKIRKGLVTHKGRTFTAEDAAYNINRIIKQPVPIGRGTSVQDMVDSATARDDSTLVLTMKIPVVSIIPALASMYLLMQPKYILEPIDKSERKPDVRPEDVDGLGPFKLTKFIPDSLFEGERFDNYYRKGLPYLDKFRMVVVPDYSTRVAIFRTGRAHMFPVSRTPTKSEADGLQAEMGDKVKFAQIATPGFRGWYFNFEKPPFDNINVRRAINMAVDRDAMSALAEEGTGILATPYAPFWNWLIPMEEYRKWPGYGANKAADLEQAKKLMKDAGYSEKNPLTFEAICEVRGIPFRHCEILRSQLKAIGAEVIIRPMETAAKDQVALAKKFQFLYQSTGVEFDDPDSFHFAVWLPQAGRNWSRWSNPQWLELFKRQQQEPDRAKRAVLLRQMAQIWFDDMAYVAALRQSLFQGWRSELRGYVPPKFHQTSYNFDELWLAKE